MAFAFLGAAIVLPIFAAFILYKFQHRLEEDKFKHKFEAMYENIDIERKLSLAYIIMFLTRRLIFSTILVYLIDYPLWQVIATYYLCFLNTMYIIVAKPFNSKILNYSEIFNEICLLIAAIHLFLYTDYMLGQVTLQYQSGFSLIAFTGLNIIVNVSMMISETFKMLKRLFHRFRWHYRKWSRQFELKRAQKQIKIKPEDGLTSTFKTKDQPQAPINKVKALNRDRTVKMATTNQDFFTTFSINQSNISGNMDFTIDDFAGNAEGNDDPGSVVIHDSLKQAARFEKRPRKRVGRTKFFQMMEIPSPEEIDSQQVSLKNDQLNSYVDDEEELKDVPHVSERTTQVKKYNFFRGEDLRSL